MSSSRLQGGISGGHAQIYSLKSDGLLDLIYLARLAHGWGPVAQLESQEQLRCWKWLPGSCLQPREYRAPYLKRTIRNSVLLWSRGKLQLQIIPFDLLGFYMEKCAPNAQYRLCVPQQTQALTTCQSLQTGVPSHLLQNCPSGTHDNKDSMQRPTENKLPRSRPKEPPPELWQRPSWVTSWACLKQPKRPGLGEDIQLLHIL